MVMNRSICYEDVEVGDPITRLEKGKLATPHLMRWSAAIENWHRIHYDLPFTLEHEKLPGLMINGSLKQQFVMQALQEWVGPDGWVWKASFQFRAMNVVGESVHVWGRVTAKRAEPGYGLVDLDIGILNESDKESTPGTATVALPFRGGKPLPYPFVPPQE